MHAICGIRLTPPPLQCAHLAPRSPLVASSPPTDALTNGSPWRHTGDAPRAARLRCMHGYYTRVGGLQPLSARGRHGPQVAAVRCVLPARRLLTTLKGKVKRFVAVLSLPCFCLAAAASAWLVFHFSAVSSAFPRQAVLPRSRREACRARNRLAGTAFHGNARDDRGNNGIKHWEYVRTFPLYPAVSRRFPRVSAQGSSSSESTQGVSCQKLPRRYRLARKRAG